MSLIDEAHSAFRARVRGFVEQQLLPHADEWEAAQELPRTVFRDFGREGLLGLTQPREHAGQELDFTYNVILAEELPRSRMLGLTVSIIAQMSLFSPLLAAFGTEDQKREYLRPAILGEKIGALASTEPGGGSDIVRAIQCLAEDDGDFWIITGEKKYITNGPIADFIVTLVRTRSEPSMNSLTLVIVPTTTDGFSVKKNLKTLGLHTSPTGWLSFDRCRVSKRLTLGKPNLGFFYLHNFLDERLLAGAIGVSVSTLVLNETISYIQNRIAFGQPLSHHQVVRHRVVEMAAQIEMARRFVHAVCENHATGNNELRAICMIKFLVADLAQRVIEQCLQLHGGYGFLEENWLTRVYRDSRLLSIGGGSSEVMKDLVASTLRL